jgi:periplasmic divalent cation tolerance protein
VTVYVTAADVALAESMGQLVVQERLAACANVLPGLTSIYRWKGKLRREPEVALLLKTREALFDRLAARLTELHDDEVPCIVAWPIACASAAFMNWVREQTEPT